MKTQDLPKRVLCIWAALILASSCSVRASELVAIDDAGGGLPGYITSLDFYDNGLFWTVYGGTCSGEFSSNPSFAILGLRNPVFPPERYVSLGCPPNAIGGASRDDAFAYYTTPGGVQRKSLGAAPAESSSLIGLAWNNLTPGAMMTFNNRAYYAFNSASSPISDSGYFRIEYFELPGNGGFFEPVVDVSNGLGLPNVGRITKMAVVYRRVIQGEPIAPFGVAMTDGGYLLRFFVDQTIPAFRTASIIATDVTDFAVRREQFVDSGPFGLFFRQDQLYVSVGRSRCPTDPLGRIITLDPITASSSTVWTSPSGYIASIAVDDDYLFASTYPRRQLGGPFGGCDLDGAGAIRSKCWPAEVFGACSSGIDPNWAAIEQGAGQNLRSDGQQLFFTRNKEVRRMPNNSPALRHDFMALGFEVVQVIQDLNNSVRLVEGKRTVVRGYARVADSSLPQTDWFPNAQLRGWRNGVELPGPLFPVNSARLTSSADWSVLRTDASRSFQFELPAEWVRSGNLTLRFTVNPNLAIDESGANPLGNNSAEQGNLAVVRVQAPCLVFATVHSTTAPNYWPWENPDGFARILNRAKSMLPVPDIHIHPTTERVSDEHVCFRTCEGPFGIPVPCGFVCNDPFDLATGAGWNEALDELKSYDSFDQNRPGCGRTHYVGAIHPSVMNPAWGGLASRPGKHQLAIMRATPTTGVNSEFGGITIAHELGHNLGRRHVDQTSSSLGCGGSPPLRPDTAYPNDTCTIGLTDLGNVAAPMGFDMIRFQPIRPNAAADLMSYAGTTWPSIYTYNAMLDALAPTGPAFAPAAAPDLPLRQYLLVRGILKLHLGNAKLKGCYSLPEGIADPLKIQQSLADAAAEPAHGYRLRKLGAGGAMIEETPLILNETEDGEAGLVVISQFITKPDAMSAVQITRDGVVLAECRATPNPPTLNAVAATYDPQGPSLQVSISATDADNDPLLFSVQFSNDGGASWRTLRVNEGSLSFIVNPRFLPGGAQCLLRVIASDGFNSAVGLSDLFVLPGRSPEAFIGGVLNGQRLPFGSSESLAGFALDAEDGSLPATVLNWNLVGPTPRAGTGASFPLQGLSPGTYTATLNSSDADANHGVATIAFEILPIVVADSAPPIMDGNVSDPAYAVAQVITPVFSAKTTARLIHSVGNLYAAFNDLPYGVANARARIGLYIDVNGSGDGTVQPSDLAFSVDEDGVTEQFEGNGTTMVRRGNPSVAFKAVITRGAGGWNAEFRIADSLLGGWEHAARVGLFHQSGWPDFMNVNSPATWAPAWFGYAVPQPVNLPPVAKAASLPYVDMSGLATVPLDATASYDPEGAVLTYAWTQLGGPSVFLNNATGPTPSFTFGGSVSTAFRFQLVVNDGQLASAPAEVAVMLRPVTSQQVEVPPAVTQNQDGTATVAVQWGGRAGDLVSIQASTDLKNWVDLTSAAVSFLQSVVFTDSQAGIYPQRFYRLAGSPADQNPAAAATALQFGGVDDFVIVPHAPALNAFPLTIAFWLRTSDSAAAVKGLVSKYQDNDFTGYSLFLHQGRVRGWYSRSTFNYVWEGELGFDSGFVADAQWHHIALVVDAAGGRLFVDGRRKSSVGWAGSPGAPTSVAPLQFGRYFNYPIGFNGEMDDIAIWNRALTDGEVDGLVPGKLTGSETGLIGYWSLDDGAGVTAADASGSGFNGTLVNDPFWVPSTAPLDVNPVAGSALSFDGVNDSVEVASVAALNPYPLTITAWIKTAQNSPGYVSVANKYVAGSGNGYSLHLHNGRLYAFYFRGNGTSYVYATDPGLDGGFLADGRWHHVAYVVDDAGGHVYVDGVLTGSLGWTGTPGPCTTTTPLRFGPYPLAGQALSLDGRLDDVTLWNRALAAAEVGAVGGFSVSGAEAGLVGFWPFDEGAGLSATDASGNGRNGTLINGPVWVRSDAPLYP
jgi:hypothetical protein